MRVIHVSRPEFFGTSDIHSLQALSAGQAALPSNLKTQALNFKDKHQIVIDCSLFVSMDSNLTPSGGPQARPKAFLH